MSRSVCLISEHPASYEDIQKFKRSVEYLQGRLVYKKAKNNYICHCYRCGKRFELNEEQFQQTKEAELCFHCGHPVKIIRHKKSEPHMQWSWLDICNEKGCINGYYVKWIDRDGDIEILGAEHVLKYDENGGRYLYGIVKNMGYSISRTDKNYWRKERWGYNSYLSYFISVNEIMSKEWKRKRDYYEDLELNDLKSNQATFIKKGIYNENQLNYIRCFDLNYPEELHKYVRYIGIHRVFKDEIQSKLTVNTLDYLDRNNYPLREYIDYLRACKSANIKAEKYPKDLYKKHDEVMQLIKVQKDKIYDAKVKERHQRLMKKEWKKGQLEIHTFTDLSNMQSVADELKNCIARMYVKPYCEETTDVYYGTIDGKVEFALEVANGKLVQLRGHCNRAVDETIEKFVKQWCTKYTYQY